MAAWCSMIPMGPNAKDDSGRPPAFDLVVVGGGVNGTAIARDAAGRGLSVLLCEQGDLAGATSSASSKLIHGGLDALERFKFLQVRRALRERDALMENALHLIHAKRFVLARGPGGRPAWKLGIGFWLYDRLGGPHGLGHHEVLDLTAGPLGAPLKAALAEGFAYSDCIVDDSRFVILTAVDAARRGAEILTQTRIVGARREAERWRVELADGTAAPRQVFARALVNASGPWAAIVRALLLGEVPANKVRLMKGSHIVLPRLYEDDIVYVLEGDDRRLVFVIPFEEDYSLIGATAVELEGDSLDMADAAADALEVTSTETRYLCDAVNACFETAVEPSDVVWSFAGVRPRPDDDSGRQRRAGPFDLDASAEEAPLVSVNDGEITTARWLAAKVLDRLADRFPQIRDPWTEEALLPGGEMDDFESFAAELIGDYPDIGPDVLRGLARRHGTLARAIIGTARRPAELGWYFGGGLHAAEVEWMMAEEWTRTPDDVLWRRSKCGLAVDDQGRAALSDYMSRNRSG